MRSRAPPPHLIDRDLVADAGLAWPTECTQCFDAHDSAAGVDVCLHCFNGGCPPAINGVESANGHGRLHFERTGHRVVVNIQRRRKPASELRRNKRVRFRHFPSLARQASLGCGGLGQAWNTLELTQRATQDSNEPPVKKLAIREEPSEAEKYDFHTQVRMYTGGEGDRATAQYVVVEQVDEKVSSGSPSFPASPVR